MGIGFRRERFEYGTVIGCGVPYAICRSCRLIVNGYVMLFLACLRRMSCESYPDMYRRKVKCRKATITSRKTRFPALLISQLPSAASRSLRIATPSCLKGRRLMKSFTSTKQTRLFHLDIPIHIYTMPGRTRPIEKFAEATAKCSPEVRSSANSRKTSS